jgi:hypothetical protein
MPYTKVTDIAYGRLQAPSLDQQEEFLVNFGMVRVARTKDALYMRGTDPNHHLHVTHLGPEKFVGFAFFVENEDELKKFTDKMDGLDKFEDPRTYPVSWEIRTDIMKVMHDLISGIKAVAKEDEL